MPKLPRSFYLREANTVAPELLGKLLVHNTPDGPVAGMIVEAEAYVGSRDKAAHSYPRRRTPRTEVQFGPGGFAYVYFIYGMHTCFNIVTNGPEEAEAVLIRALEPAWGLDYMAARRKVSSPQMLCSGPGRLCQALGIERSHNGCDLCGDELFLLPWQNIPPAQIMVSPRINVDYAGDCAALPWRYFIRDNPYLSRVPRRYTLAASSYKCTF